MAGFIPIVKSSLQLFIPSSDDGKNKTDGSASKCSLSSKHSDGSYSDDGDFDEDDIPTSSDESSQPSETTQENLLLPFYNTFRNETKSIDVSRQNRVRFNVSGTTFETFKSTLEAAKGFVPPLKDHKFLSEHWDDARQEYYFERRPAAFRVVLNYMRTGVMHLPNGNDTLCSYMITKEMSYWGILDVFVEPCCWKDNLNRFLFLENYKRIQNDTTLTLHNKASSTVREKVYALVTSPPSSKAAMVYLYTTLVIVISGIMIFAIRTSDWSPTPDDWWNTVEQQGNYNYTVVQTTVPWLEDFMSFMDKAEYIFFTFDFLANLLCCPVWYRYLLSFQGLMDGIPLVLDNYALTDAGKVTGFTDSSILRAFRSLRLCSRLRPIVIVKFTLITTAGDLFVMCILLMIVVVIISSVAYRIEKNEPDSSFTSIPQSCWWGVITMTHVGYGDIVPKTLPGRLVASVAMFMELLVLGLMIPPLQQAFNSYSEILNTMHQTERSVEMLETKETSQLTSNLAYNHPIDPSKLRRRRSGMSTARLPHECETKDKQCIRPDMPFYDMLI